jgi:acyl dehydratase
MMIRRIERETFRQPVGTEIGLSDCQAVDQHRIKLLCLSHDDHQFIRVDEKRATQETPFKPTSPMVF